MPLKGQLKANRFWSKVAKTDGCWLWTGRKKQGKGYGAFWTPSNVNYPAHRYAWELKNGPVPTGLELDHLCRVRHCVNPAHLEAVTHRENVLRGTSPLARNARVTHCPRGHEYAGQNLIAHRGERRCRACHNRHRKDRNARQG